MVRNNRVCICIACLFIIFLSTACSSEKTVHEVERTELKNQPALEVVPPMKPEAKTPALKVKPVAGLPFTVDNFLAHVPGLRPLESLGEFRTSQKFSCDFADGSGVITGEYAKKDRKLQHLTVVGDGPTWVKAVEIAIVLSIKDVKKGNQLMQNLSEASLAETSLSSDGLTYHLNMLLGKHFFLVSNESDPVEDSSRTRS